MMRVALFGPLTPSVSVSVMPLLSVRIKELLPRDDTGNVILTLGNSAVTLMLGVNGLLGRSAYAQP